MSRLGLAHTSAVASGHRRPAIYCPQQGPEISPLSAQPWLRRGHLHVFCLELISRCSTTYCPCNTWLHGRRTTPLARYLPWGSCEEGTHMRIIMV